MIVVLAARTDRGARALVDRWPAGRARVLTPADLTRPGWVSRPGDPGGSRAVVDGEVVPVAEISGVLTRTPAVSERDLPMIVDEDRAYAATEMTAFLVYWLGELPCPVLNRPSGAGLSGPARRPDGWVRAAARLGLPAEPRHRHVPVFGTGPPVDPVDPIPPVHDVVTVTVVGDRVVGDVDDEVAVSRARLLARDAGVDLLVARFRGADRVLVDAHPWPDVFAPAVADALLAHLSAPEPVSSLPGVRT